MLPFFNAIILKGDYMGGVRRGHGGGLGCALSNLT